jgi:hypothetical protein
MVELTQKLVASTAIMREEYTSLLLTITEILEVDIADLTGYSRPSMLIADVLCISPRQAGRLISHAEAIAEVRTPTGHLTPARLPVLREALLDGALDPEHVDAILRVVKKIPTWTSGDTAEIVEKHLVEIAREAPASVVAKHGEMLLARIDADGVPPKEELAQPKNAFRYRRDAAGWMHFAGSIEPESAEELDAMLGALAKPDGATDERSTTQRLGDAFCDVVHHAIDSDTLPARGGEKPHLNLTMDYATLVKGVGTATLEGGAEISASAVRRIACDSQIVPMVLNGESVPLDVGRTRRLVSTKQRAALNARDAGCTFPSCGLPARWADAHHIKSWLDGGPTDLDNMVLLCRRHHRLIHHSEWTVRMTATGHPEFIPPRWIDPDQAPRRNLLHLRK